MAGSVMATRALAWGSFLLATVSTVNGQMPGASDVIKNFCKRLEHQSTVKNGTLYIDGGLQVFANSNKNGNPSGEEVLGYNTFLIEIDMTRSWNWQKTGNFSAVAVNKTANPSTGTSPPASACRGSMFQGGPEDPSIYLYGGTVDYRNTSAPTFNAPDSAQYALWSYNTQTQVWGQHDITVNVPLKPNMNAYTEAPDQELAFSLGGQVDSGTSNAYQQYGSGFIGFLPGLTIINTTDQTARNLTTDNLPDSPRSGGSLTYVPAIGSKGAVVAIGGSWKSAANGDGTHPGTYIDPSQIDIFDVASSYSANASVSGGTWYRQKATGQIPAPRTEFCLVTVSASDKSSHNIYLYGGMGTNGSAIDDLYVLSMPSFQWTLIYSGQSPRYGHTCHLVGNRQFVTVGGTNDTDLPRGCDWESSSVAIYDMSALNWGSAFDANAAPYALPSQLTAVIGGGPNGNATNTQPSGGFQTAALASLFQGKEPSSSSTPSATPTPINTTSPVSGGGSGLSGGAIAGIVIGCVAGVALLAALIFFLVRRRRQQHESTAAAEAAAEEPEMSSTSEYKDPMPNNGAHVAGTKLHELPSSQKAAGGELSGHSVQELQSPESTPMHEMQANNRNPFAVELDSGNPYRPPAAE